MAVIIKRSNGHVMPECPYGCCTPVYGRHVKLQRRKIKNAERREAKKDIASQMD